jgi:hypothetical protein
MSGSYDCKAIMRIRYAKNTSAPSAAFIQMSGTHDHERLKDKGLSTPVKMEIKAMDEPSGGQTASTIQRKLQVGKIPLHNLTMSKHTLGQSRADRTQAALRQADPGSEVASGQQARLHQHAQPRRSAALLRTEQGDPM